MQQKSKHMSIAHKCLAQSKKKTPWWMMEHMKNTWWITLGKSRIRQCSGETQWLLGCTYLHKWHLDGWCLGTEVFYPTEFWSPVCQKVSSSFCQFREFGVCVFKLWGCRRPMWLCPGWIMAGRHKEIRFLMELIHFPRRHFWTWEHHGIVVHHKSM